MSGSQQSMLYIYYGKLNLNFKKSEEELKKDVGCSIGYDYPTEIIYEPNLDLSISTNISSEGEKKMVSKKECLSLLHLDLSLDSTKPEPSMILNWAYIHEQQQRLVYNDRIV